MPLPQVMRNGNTQSSWGFRIQSQRNYWKPLKSKSRSARVNDDGADYDKRTIIDFNRVSRLSARWAILEE
jgi:hypothetical protein